MLAYLVQVGNEGVQRGTASLLEPALLIVAGACAGGLLIGVLRFVVERARAPLVRRRERRRRLWEAATAERRARAMMSELCPHGWRAQITVHDGVSGAEDGDAARRPVALDWFELRPGGSEPAVTRRVWAPTVAEALEAMVADRRTDETLEQIELRATADGALWPDL